MTLFKRIVYFLIHLGVVCLVFGAFILYTSLFEIFPWYDGCGMQFFALILYIGPGLLVLGIISIIFGFFYRMTRLDRFYPLFAGISVCLPLFLDGSLSNYMRYGGTIISVLVIALTVKYIITDIWSRGNCA